MSKEYALTFTVTIADPAVISLTEHNFDIGDEIILFTTGALPTGLLASSDGTYYSYFVVRDGFGANSFQVALDKGGVPIITTGTQSGTHTLLRVGGNILTPIISSFI